VRVYGGHGFAAVRAFADDVVAGTKLEELPEACPDRGVVVDEKHFHEPFFGSPKRAIHPSRKLCSNPLE
jgi:hypothetical protein